MKLGSTDSDWQQFFSDLDDNQMEVASILLQLKQLIASRNGLQLDLRPSWGSRRKRSAEAFSLMRCGGSPAAAPESAFQETGKSAGKAEATSPATPLSFSPSESDEKPKRLKRKISVKKRREELLEIEKKCTITNELLRKEIEQSRHYLQQLEAQNSSLQARKQELMEKEKLKWEENGGEIRGIMMNEEVGPNGIPDLNVSLPIWMDFVDEDSKIYSKAMAAQARQRRMQICRDKNSSAITKLRNSRK